ncbi:MAG TPA: signal peptide peptidase SppA [Thermoanaerobaculia bacterium]|nr:signal peptide peptidase SppA [Thermoanaerobaculia bacterium]
MSELEPPQIDPGDGQEVPPAPPPPPASTPAAAAPHPQAAVAAAPPVVPPRRRTGVFFFGALTGCAIVVAGLLFLGLMIAMFADDSGELSLAGDKVAVISIEGEIMEARETVDALRKYADNVTVKAIVIRINSPGGAIAPSQEIFSAIRHTRQSSGKPIVASMDSMAASGGYYIAVACDDIVANPGTITGSIGVILQWFDMKELVRWAKLKPETITSGALKDAGSPYRELTDAERQYFQDIVSQLHSQFVRDVALGRAGKLKHDEVAKLADGRVFTGEQALKLKLVDRLGSVDDAVRHAGKLAGIKGEPAKLWPRRREPGLFDLLSDTDADTLMQRIVSRRVPQFLYRW